MPLRGGEGLARDVVGVRARVACEAVELADQLVAGGEVGADEAEAAVVEVAGAGVRGGGEEGLGERVQGPVFGEVEPGLGGVFVGLEGGGEGG